MNETTRRFARLVDLSAVQATSTEADVRACAELAARYNIISVHVLPCWTRFLSTLLPQQGTGEVMIGGPVGFPGGGHTTDTKVQEVRQLIADGAREVDMVVNIGKVLSGDYDYVREDLRRVVEAAAPVPAKVILETHLQYFRTGRQVKRGNQEFFRIIFIRFTPNPHDLRAIGHQNDTGRDQAAYRGSGFVSAKQFEPFYGGREIAGAGCALCNIPR